jgi:peptidoglycan/LPS O-acetylase OafA/YrhL
MDSSFTKTTATILQTKPHFHILDGLRGVAPLAVVLFHFMEWVFEDFSKNFIAHGFLAVDFFFCLSGFVIGYAYDDRIAKIGVLEFFILFTDLCFIRSAATTFYC